jgi:lysyl-tRNA synthetase class 2
MEQKNTQKNAPEEKSDRLNKLNAIKGLNLTPYADKYERTHDIKEARDLDLGTNTSIAGRIILSRNMGKMGFCQLQDHTGVIQLVLKVGDIDEESYKNFFKITSLGDFVGVEGELFETQKGEISVLIKKYTFLSKALRPLPEKMAWTERH